jgi:hypothetical protein
LLGCILWSALLHPTWIFLNKMKFNLGSKCIIKLSSNLCNTSNKCACIRYVVRMYSLVLSLKFKQSCNARIWNVLNVSTFTLNNWRISVRILWRHGRDSNRFREETAYNVTTWVAFREQWRSHLSVTCFPSVTGNPQMELTSRSWKGTLTFGVYPYNPVRDEASVDRLVT